MSPLSPLYLFGPECPNCQTEMKSSDSGEPLCQPGWFCPVCNEFFYDDEIDTTDLETGEIEIPQGTHHAEND